MKTAPAFVVRHDFPLFQEAVLEDKPHVGVVDERIAAGSGIERYRSSSHVDLGANLTVNFS